MSGSMTVSVVMPVRNEEDSIAEAVGSVLRQTLPPAEVLVVDGDSTDGTAEIVRGLSRRDGRVRLLSNPERAISPALNVGLACAQGDLVARVDAHATVSDTYIERAVGHLAADDELVAVGGRRRGVAGSPTGRAIALALSSPFGVGNSINHYATEVQETDHASFGVYRADWLRKVDGWDPALIVNEDVDLDHRLVQSGARILYDPDMTILWHVRETVLDLGRQYRRYGRGKGSMVRKNGPSAVRARHLAAPLLVVSMAVSAGLLATRRVLPGALLLGAYAGALAVGTGSIVRRAQASGEADGVRAEAIPMALAAMHCGWGVGFIEGLAGARPHAASKR